MPSCFLFTEERKLLALSETVEPITSKGTAVINPTNVAPNRICFSLMFPVVKNMVYLLNRTVITAIVYKDTNFLANFYNIILKMGQAESTVHEF